MKERKLSGLKRLLAIGACALLALLFLVEVVLRFVPVPGFTRAELVPAYVASEKQHRTQGHPYLGYSLKANWSREASEKEGQKSHNSLHLRGPETTLAKPPGVTRIICLGGSSTYGSTPSSDAATWPARLQEHLNEARPDRPVEVLNGGAIGWSTFESIANLAFRMVDFQPDLVIVYHTINDARCALYREPVVRDNSHWRDVWPVYRPSPLEPVLERSMTYLIWRKYFTDYLTARADLGFYAIVNYQKHEKDMYVSGPTPARGLLNFQRNLVTLQAIAKAHGAEVLFATQALDRTDIVGTSAESTMSQLAAMDEMRGIIEQVATERGRPFVNAGRIFEEEAARRREAGEEELFTGEVHLTDVGADFLARILADKIQADELLPR